MLVSAESDRVIDNGPSSSLFGGSSLHDGESLLMMIAGVDFELFGGLSTLSGWYHCVDAVLRGCRCVEFMMA